ncbi:Trp operon repressor [Moraxella macacae 0408225]|uniref:Trp operon repressor n=1 Tax=Moraxella macacae 0408225 TaxID=1230338 RepID=L2F892_9GAMM|nr:Trp family transcriptional regulator [Moraxella macacae]ELA09100.1 Trp operon repressor [Moraxella macacae 0408225]
MSLSTNYPVYQAFMTLLANESDAVFLAKLFDAMLTDKEQAEIAKRLQIFALLQQGLPQREIAERLCVGIATVSRGAKAYQVNQVANLLPNLQAVLANHLPKTSG